LSAIANIYEDINFTQLKCGDKVSETGSFIAYRGDHHFLLPLL